MPRAPPAGSASVLGGVTGISRFSQTLEIWWTAPNGAIQDAFWFEGGVWTLQQIAPAGSASTSATIAAVLVGLIPTAVGVYLWRTSGSSAQLAPKAGTEGAGVTLLGTF